VDGAWAFLKYLLSQEVQEQGRYFPVQRAAFEAVLEGAKYPGSDSRSSLPGNRQTPLSESEIQMVRDFTENATRRTFRNDPIQDIIEEEAQSYFAGDKTAQEVAEIIEKRVKIYLGESS
jgi:multiple sugar transport system substrate-binding protein